MIKKKILLGKKEFFTLKNKSSTEILFKSSFSDVPVVIAELKDDYLAQVITKGLCANDISKSFENTLTGGPKDTFTKERLTNTSAKEKHHSRMAFLNMVMSITNLILLIQLLSLKY